MLRQNRGFTLVELITAIAVIGIALALFAIYGATYRDGARFSSTIRTFHNSLNEARIKAVGNQTTVQLIPRPTVPNVSEDPWKTGVNYAAGRTVKREGLSYTCTQAHTSSAVNEPIVGTGAGAVGWQSFWSLARVYVWYDGMYIVIRDPAALNPPGDPGNADPFSEANPINIQFNARGFTADFVDHSFTITRNPGSQAKAGDPGVGFTITSLGRIVQTGAP